jgi:hypothetical protein
MHGKRRPRIHGSVGEAERLLRRTEPRTLPLMGGIRAKIFVVAVGLGLVSSCWLQGVGPARFHELLTPMVKKQAAFDLQCAEDQIQVVAISDASFGASGCGRRASYVPESDACRPDQPENIVKGVCTAVVANVASKSP